MKEGPQIKLELEILCMSHSMNKETFNKSIVNLTDLKFITDRMKNKLRRKLKLQGIGMKTK